MAEAATIDELRIDIESDAANATGGLDLLIQRLERLKTAVTGAVEGNGLNKIAKQMTKLKEAAQSISTLSGFENLDRLANSLNALNNVGNGRAVNINPMINSLRRLAEVVPTVNALPNINVAKIGQLSEIAAPFQGINVRNLNSFISAIRRLPTIAADLANIDLDGLTGEMQRLAAAMRPLADEMNQVAAGFSAMPQRLQQYITQMERANTGTRAGGGLSGLGATLGTIRTRALAVYGSLAMLFNKLADCVKISNRFVENLNLFRVTMGDTADEAYAFAEAVNEAMGIDVSDWVRYQGFFQSIGKGFGIVTEKADLMSKTLTQLSYDISSFYNVSVEEAYNKVVSGLSGELEPLRRYGFALDEATLKQLALKKGITQSVESMTLAQKAQLRYVAILEQANSIGILGDMSRTIDTSANQLRILSARFAQFARALGNLVMPVLSAVLPYFTAFIQVATDAAQHLAEMFGFELPKIDIGTANITTGYDDIAEAADGATAATEKFKGSLAGVDQLNIIGSKSDAGAGSGDGLLYDLDITLPTYDFLNGVESKTKQIYENMKRLFSEITPWPAEFGVALAGVFIGSKIVSATSSFGRLAKTISDLGGTIGPDMTKNILGMAGGLATGASSGVMLYSAIKRLITGTGDLGNSLGLLATGIAVAGTAIAAFIALGNPVGAVITGIGAALGVLGGVIVGINENIKEQNEAIADSVLYNNGGTKITAISDAFSKWANSAADVNRETIEKYQQLDVYNEKIDATLEIMKDISGTDLNLDEITPADAEALKAPFEELVGYLQDEFSERTKLIADDLKTAFANLGIESAVSVQVQQAYRDMQRTFDEDLSESQKIVSKYMDMMGGGATLTQAQMEEFTNEYNYVLALARNENNNTDSVQKAIDDFGKLNVASIDFENDTTAQTALGNMVSEYMAYVTSEQDVLRSQLEANDELRRTAQISLQYGKIDETEYQNQLDILKLADMALFKDYAKSISDINSQIAPLLSQMDTQFINAASQQSATWETFFRHFFADGEIWNSPIETLYNLGDYAQGDYLEDSPAYQSLEELAELVSTPIPAELVVDMTYDPNSKYAPLFEAMGGTPMEVPVTFVADDEFKPYYGDNSQYANQLKPNYGGYTGVNSQYALALGSKNRTASYASPLDYDTIARATAAYESGSLIKAPTYNIKKSESSNMSLARSALADTLSGVGGSDDRDINITLYSTVEMDGDAVGESVARYNSRSAYVANGR